MDFDESFDSIYNALVLCKLHDTGAGSFITDNKEGIILLLPTESEYIVLSAFVGRNKNDELIKLFRWASEMLPDNITNADENTG